jgi:crotonobetainyl-CoA:carnitine CoA-transferase CaiB-like acyl-CoA transferase
MPVSPASPASPGSPAAAAAPLPPGPLDGVRVLDFTRVLAGPHATRMLHDLGAEVLKIEPPAGDLTRFSYPRLHGMATYFAQQNAGKRNLSIDLRQPAGVQLAKELADHCDVLIENYRPGVLARMGLGPDELMARNPRLIYVSISGYGASGPWVHRRAYAPVVGAEAGITKSQGDARGAVYANDPHSHGDVYTGIEAATAVLAALYHRERTGAGQWIDVSMAETLMYVNEHLHDQLYDGPVDPAWIRSFGNGDYLVFTIADGTRLIVSGHPAERGSFELFLAALGLEHLRDDDRFRDVPSRLAHFEELRALLLAAAAEIPDADTFEERFAEHKLASGVLRDARELAESEWAQARGAVVEVSDRGGGSIRIPNAPWHFSGAAIGVRGEPRYRGEDNRDVLAELLGYDDAAIDGLEADGVLSSRIPRPAPSSDA